MDMQANVLRADATPEHSFEAEQSRFIRIKSDEYRTAVSRIIAEIQLERGLDDEALGEILGCSESTVANARNKRGNLDPVTMLNLGALFGGQERIRPILALINGCPVETPTILGRLNRMEAETRALRKAIEERDQC